MTTVPISFRAFRVADAPRLERWLTAAGMPLPDRVSRDVWADRMSGGDPRIHALAAIAVRTAVAFLRLDLAPDRSAELTLIVDPRHRRRGVGAQLVERAIAEARRIGLRRLAAMVRPENDAALRLFANHGFEPSAVRMIGFLHLARVVHRADTERPLEITP